MKNNNGGDITMDLDYITRDFLVTLKKGRKLRKSVKAILQDFVNCRYKSDLPHVILPIETSGILLKNGVTIPINEEMYSIQEVLNGYNFSDLREDDVFLDIGANFGAVSLYVAGKVESVHAFEPVFINELKENIDKNNIKNIKTYQYALSKLESATIEYRGKQANVPGLTLKQIKEMCGESVTFMKCDCEKAEWCIRPGELGGIRAIEIEVHLFGGEKCKDFTDMLESVGFFTITEMEQGRTVIVHARR
jgi:FkbM family methyltransferase